MNSQGWSPSLGWDQCPYKKRQNGQSSLSVPPGENTKRRQGSQARKRSLTRTWPCWHLWLPTIRTLKNKSVVQATLYMVFYYNSLSRLKQCLRAHIWTVTYTDLYIYTYISIKEPDLIGTTHTVLFPTTQNARGRVSEPLGFLGLRSRPVFWISQMFTISQNGTSFFCSPHPHPLLPYFWRSCMLG